MRRWGLARTRPLSLTLVSVLLIVMAPWGWSTVWAAVVDGPGTSGGTGSESARVQAQATATPTPAGSPHPGPNAPPAQTPKPGSSGNGNSDGSAPPPPTPPSAATLWATSCGAPVQAANPAGLTDGSLPLGAPAQGCGAPTVPNGPPQTALNMATSPPPNVGPYLAQAMEQILTRPGTISAAPPNHTGLVNLPQCYWVTGQSVPKTQTISMDLKGAPNAAGQQITYHISLTVWLDKMVWNFGDGSQQTTTVPLPCVGDSGDPQTLVAHNYTTYSQDQPNGTFLVTASETYQASAVMTWIDDTGSRQMNVPLNPASEEITTAPYPVQIEQEEGVGG